MEQVADLPSWLMAAGLVGVVAVQIVTAMSQRKNGNGSYDMLKDLAHKLEEVRDMQRDEEAQQRGIEKILDKIADNQERIVRLLERREAKNEGSNTSNR